MLNLSHLTSYLTCPRLCYYRLRDREKGFTESQAAREIYISLRRGFDIAWAEERAKTLHDFDEEVFRTAASKLVFSDLLNDFKPVDWDIVVRSERFGLSFVIDEIVEFDSRYPLFVSLKAPQSGVWFRDAIKVAAACMVCGFDAGLVYYAYSGELRRCELSFGLKRSFLKLLERVRMVANGFLPERKRSAYCESCRYREVCDAQPETFASKFL